MSEPKTHQDLPSPQDPEKGLERGLEKTPEEAEAEQLAKYRYRFNGVRGGFRGSAHWGPDQWVPEGSGFTSTPRNGFTFIELL